MYNIKQLSFKTTEAELDVAHLLTQLIQGVATAHLSDLCPAVSPVVSPPVTLYQHKKKPEIVSFTKPLKNKIFPSFLAVPTGCAGVAIHERHYWYQQHNCITVVGHVFIHT